MAARGGGRIVNVTSAQGSAVADQRGLQRHQGGPAVPVAHVRRRVGGQGVLVNAVAPGPVASPLWMAPGGLAEQTAAARGVSREEAIAIQEAKVPLGRFAEPGEIADVVVFLCSDRASTVTGAAWSADGGAVAIII